MDARFYNGRETISVFLFHCDSLRLHRFRFGKLDVQHAVGQFGYCLLRDYFSWKLGIPFIGKLIKELPGKASAAFIILFSIRISRFGTDNQFPAVNHHLEPVF